VRPEPDVTTSCGPGPAWLWRPLLAGLLCLAFSSLSIQSANAYFGADGNGGGAAGTDTLSAATTVQGSFLGGGTVALTWEPATLGSGQPAAGYYVERVRTSDSLTVAACGTSPISLRATPSCSDATVPLGTYRYRVIAVLQSWTTTSVLGNSVTVAPGPTPPTISLASIAPLPNGGGFNNSSPVTVAVAAAPGSAGTPVASITMWVDARAPVTTPGATGTTTVSEDGVHTVSFYATDAVGRQSATGSQVVRIDTVAPSAPLAPALTAATDTGASSADGITNNTAPMFTGSAEAGSTVRIYDGATLIGTGVATGGTFTIPSSTLTSTTHTVTARATDPAGNVSVSSAASIIVVDTTAPVAPSVPVLTTASDSGRSSTDRITNDTTPTFSGTAENSATVTVYDGAVASGSGLSLSGNWTATSSSLTDGVRTITARATDLAGNTSVLSAAMTVTIDTLAPAPPTEPNMRNIDDSGPSDTDSITNEVVPIFQGGTERRSIVTLLDGGGAISVSSPANSGNYTVKSPPLADGTHAMSATATDAAGNISAPSTAVTVVIDTVAPSTSAPRLISASDTGVSSTDQITRLTSVSVTGTTQAGATVVLRDNGAQIATGTADPTGTFTLAVTLAAGSHTLTATSTDLAGNLGASSGGAVVVVDTTSPTVTLNQAVGQADPALASPVLFTAVFSESVYDLTGADLALGGTAGATTATVTGSGATYTISVSGMQLIGPVTLTLPAGRTTDAAGNGNAASTSTDNSVLFAGF
jgi:Bacterial Ig-like domain